MEIITTVLCHSANHPNDTAVIAWDEIKYRYELHINNEKGKSIIILNSKTAMKLTKALLPIIYYDEGRDENIWTTIQNRQ